MVKDASLDSQSTVVWNTLMKCAIIARRFTLSFELFIDMKRRGFKANIRTYFTLLSGWAKAEHREITPRQLERAKTVFGEYIDYMAAVKAKDPASPELGNKPVNEYLSILNRARLYQTMFDVFYGMEKSGPLAPDQFTFTVMINAIGSRKALHAGGETPPEGGESDVHAQNASDVRFLWKQLVKASQRCGFPIDSHVITGTIFALAKGTSIDRTLAISIIHDYLGLSQPGESTINATVPLSKQLLTSILTLCNSTQQPRLTLHYAQRIMDSPQREVLQRTHLNEVLRAYSFLSTPDNPTEAAKLWKRLEWMVRQEVMEGSSRAVLRPDLESYNLALLACWRSAAWSTACRVFEMMSGYSMLDFEKPARKAGTRSASTSRSRSRIILPDAESMSTLARTALTQRAPDTIRQCLRIIAHLGPDHFFIPLDGLYAEKVLIIMTSPKSPLCLARR
ncbi:hypothetical protein BS47DRAFT_1362592 [Hydnum rufescens UP504]|uniref:Pentatricopeptide repeat-containing protein n=1 Tax=Hydnum rufescens UP504 TaxID=1448309 RepID=A0A9P6AWM9_9AGAM|nr:hypothetical protein BS47DRAFT_1362592 [Hydnum rufescens UP504]